MSWSDVLIFIVIYFLCLFLIFGISGLLRIIIDKPKKINKKAHKDSLDILYETTTNDEGLEIGSLFQNLEKNNMDTSFKTKID